MNSVLQIYTHTHTQVQNNGGLFRMDGDMCEWRCIWIYVHTHTYIYLDQNSLSYTFFCYIYYGKKRNVVKSLSIIQLQ